MKTYSKTFLKTLFLLLFTLSSSAWAQYDSNFMANTSDISACEERLADFSAQNVLLSQEVSGQGCKMHCPLKILGHCIGKFKVCDIKLDAKFIENAGKEIAKAVKMVEQGWKSVYKKSLPKWARKFIESNVVLLVGSITGGLGYAELAAQLENVGKIIRGRWASEQVKTVLQAVLDQIKKLVQETIASADLAQIDIATSGQKAKQYYIEHINPVIYDFLVCVGSKPSEWNHAVECARTFEHKKIDIVMDARRHGCEFRPADQVYHDEIDRKFDLLLEN